MLSNLKIKIKLWLILGLSLVGAIFIQVYELQQAKSQLLEGREAELVHLVESAALNIDYFYEQRSSLGEENAKAQALAAIGKLRYDAGKGYFWINDLNAAVVMHPIQPSLNGKNLSHLEDPDGVKIFKEFAKIGKSSGAGVVRYKWEEPGSDVLAAKSSYVQLFEPWGWVIGTGVYIDDIDEVFWSNAQHSMIFLAIVFSVVSVLVGFIASNITKPLGEMVRSMKLFSEGDLQNNLKTEDRDDELGQLLSSCVAMQNTFRELVLHSQDSANQIAGAADTMAVVTEQSGAGVRRQYEETDMLAAAIEELASTIKEVGGNAAETADLTGNADKGVAESTHLMKETIETINNVSSDVARAGDVVRKLETDIKQIDSILDVIRNISEQTNLLALNAAIEAARAGESGRGFAVVADEVRTLAQRTQESTEEIQKMTEHLQAESRNAVEVMSSGKENSDSCVEKAQQTSDNLTRVAQQVTDVSDRNVQVAATVAQQGTVANEISDNITTIREVAHETMEGGQLLSDSSLKLKQLTDETKNMLAKFHL